MWVCFAFVLLASLVTVGAASPISVEVSATPDPVKPGEAIEYVITVSNKGGADLTGAVVRTQVPERTSLSGVDALEPKPDGISSSFSYNPGTNLIWTLGTLPAGVSRALVFRPQVSSTTPVGTVIALTARAAATGVTEVSDLSSVTINSAAVLMLSIKADKDPVAPGGKLRYTLVYGNRSTVNAPNAVLQVGIPAGTTFSSASDGAFPSGSTLQWPLGATLSPGESGSREFEVTVNQPAPDGTLILAEATLQDSLDPKNMAEAGSVATVRAASPISVEVSATPDPVKPGEAIEYVITVSNKGAADLTGAVVRTQVPERSSLSGVDALEPKPDGISSSFSYNPGTNLIWTLGTLLSGESRVLVFRPKLSTSNTPNGTIIGLVARALATGVPEVSDQVTTVVDTRSVFTVSLSSSPTAGGVVYGGGTVVSGSSRTVTATPASGYSFVNWTEGGIIVSTSASYSFTANANRTLVGNFTQNSVSYAIGVSASPSAGGSVSGGGNYPSGTTVNLSAVAASGYSFVNWTEGGIVVSTSAGYSFTASANRTLVANFTVTQNPIFLTIETSATPSAGGSVSGGGLCLSGATVTLNAVAASGYSFVNWTEGSVIVSTSASYSFAASANRTLVANFLQNAVSVAINASASPNVGGIVSGGGFYTPGATVNLNAVAASGYSFVNWTEGNTVVNTSANYSFTANGHRNLVANFVENITITLSASPEAGGTVDGGGASASGGLRTVTAVSANGFAFEYWTENGTIVGTDASYTFTANDSRALVANFVPADVKTLREVAGTYQGFKQVLGQQANDPRLWLAETWFVQLTVRKTGDFTGYARIGKQRWPFSGRFDPVTGLWPGKIVYRKTAAGKIGRGFEAIHLDLSGRDEIVGTPSQPTLLRRAGHQSKKSGPAPQQGSYSVVLLPELEFSALGYSGSGQGVIEVNKRGLVKFNAQFGDSRSSLKQSAYISKGGKWPFFQRLPWGQLAGWVTIKGELSGSDIIGKLDATSLETPISAAVTVAGERLQ